MSDWKIPPAAQPRPEHYAYDLDQALTSVLGLRALVPSDAFTAEILGTERAGNGVLIREDGIVLTVGYLVTEAEAVWLTSIDGRATPAHVVAYDQETGFGLVQALGPLDVPVLPLGESRTAPVGAQVVMAGIGGRKRSVAAHIVAKQEFAGYWEYLLDEAILTAPAHPHWGGCALIGPGGDLLGIGSLHIQHASETGPVDLNMVVPIDLLKPILDDLLGLGRPMRPPRPWLGLYATEAEDGVTVIGVATGGPADRAGLAAGDLLLAVSGHQVDGLAALFRRVWALGPAGIEVPLLVSRDGRTIEVTVASADRRNFLKGPKLH